jgi:hypothetical protein
MYGRKRGVRAVKGVWAVEGCVGGEGVCGLWRVCIGGGGFSALPLRLVICDLVEACDFTSRAVQPCGEISVDWEFTDERGSESKVTGEGATVVM